MKMNRTTPMSLCEIEDPERLLAGSMVILYDKGTHVPSDPYRILYGTQNVALITLPLRPNSGNVVRGLKSRGGEVANGPIWAVRLSRRSSSSGERAVAVPCEEAEPDACESEPGGM